jgi:hypothetical protein
LVISVELAAAAGRLTQTNGARHAPVWPELVGWTEACMARGNGFELTQRVTVILLACACAGGNSGKAHAARHAGDDTALVTPARGHGSLAARTPYSGGLGSCAAHTTKSKHSVTPGQ